MNRLVLFHFRWNSYSLSLYTYKFNEKTDACPLEKDKMYENASFELLKLKLIGGLPPKVKQDQFSLPLAN